MNRTRAFVVSCLGAIIVIAAYVLLAPSPSGTNPSPGGDGPELESIAALPAPPFILFRDGSSGPSFGRLAVAALAGTEADARQQTPLSCERVHYAAGSGVCMTTDQTRMPVRHEAFVFDRSFKRRHTIALTGPPIRARVSPDGRRAAMTVFETGHSYADAAFSTRTILIDTASGQRIADLEEFAIEKDGQPFSSVDFNFWGVTFDPDSDRFFATLKSAGATYLIRGSIDRRQASIVRSGVECPSLSPDGTLLVYKKPLEHGIGWRLHVLDLASQHEQPLNQVTPSVDDQVDWFDDRAVIYHDAAGPATGVWVLPVDGVSPPRLLLPSAYSPAVQR